MRIRISYGARRWWILGMMAIASLIIFQNAGGALPSQERSYSSITGVNGEAVYLPILQHFPIIPSIFGVEISQISDAKGFDKVTAARTYWVRNFVFNWSEIEPDYFTIPVYHWDAVDEAGLIQAASQGAEVIATIKLTPSWAQKVPGYACGPVRRSSLDEFARFMSNLVERYSQYPYQIKYWEIGNEPDVDPDLVNPDSLYGCWGDKSDNYYGGGYYAEALKSVYPVIKQANPEAKVVIGGLLLNCDPTNLPECPDPKPGKFFEGILHHNGQLDGHNYFDFVSFHGYSFFNGTLQRYENSPSWGSRGGVVLGKVDFLREVMTSYGVEKPIMHTEGSLVCPEWMPPSNYDCNHPPDHYQKFFEAQADYVIWLYVRNWAAGLTATIWYQFDGPGWRFGGMLDGAQNPKPVYFAYHFLTQELYGTTYSQQIFDYPDFRAYEFIKADKRIWVLWPPVEHDPPLVFTLPVGVLQVLDKYGAQIIPIGGQITVEHPVYIELAK